MVESTKDSAARHSVENDVPSAGRFLRERCATPDAERDPADPVRQSRNGYVPCGREHARGQICLLPDGHVTPPDATDTKARP